FPAPAAGRVVGVFAGGAPPAALAPPAAPGPVAAGACWSAAGAAEVEVELGVPAADSATAPVGPAATRSTGASGRPLRPRATRAAARVAIPAPEKPMATRRRRAWRAGAVEGQKA